MRRLLRTALPAGPATFTVLAAALALAFGGAARADEQAAATDVTDGAATTDPSLPAQRLDTVHVNASADASAGA